MVSYTRSVSGSSLVGLALGGAFALLVGVGALASSASAQPAEARGVDEACAFVDLDDPQIDFPDIGGFGTQTQDAIRCAAAYDIVAGHTDGTYRPGEPILRYQMALFLNRVLGWAEATNVLDVPDDPEDPFDDVGGVSPAAQTAIATLYELEVTTGTTATTFSPFDPVSRRDMASFLVRLQDLLEPGSYDTDETDVFPDVPTTLERDEHINALALQGIVQGHADGTYRPFASVTRGHMALFVMRHVDENVDSGRLLAEGALTVDVEGPGTIDEQEPAEYEIRATNQGGVDPFEQLHVLLNVRFVGADDATIELCPDAAAENDALTCPADEWTTLPLEDPAEADLVFAQLPGEDEHFPLPAGEEEGMLVRITLDEPGEYEIVPELTGAETVGTIYDWGDLGVVVGPWASCATDDYTVEYPGHWFTNDEPIDDLPPCALFDPDPDETDTVNQEVSGEVGVFMRLEDIAFDDAVEPGPDETVLSRTATTVDGQPAERIEVVTTDDAFFPEGTQSVRWVVDLDGETFIAVSRDLGLPLYWQKVLVLDRMMDRVEFQ